jgi:hypothetical protein
MKDFLTVGFCGVAGSGKTTLAQSMLLSRGCLSDRITLKPPHYPTARIMRFASPLKDGLAIMGITKEKQPDLYRKTAQILGTDLIRAHNPDHWVDYFQYNVEKGHFREGTIILIDDVRFANEASLCNLLFYVHPCGFVPSPLVEGRENHPSEEFARDIIAPAQTVATRGELKPITGVDALGNVRQVWVVANTKDEIPATSALISSFILAEHDRRWPPT